jgi:hypothetical protein
VRHAARRDANDAIITDALRKAGFTVTDFGKAGQGIPDKLVTKLLPDGKSWVCWVEIKMPTGQLREAQEAFKNVFEGRGEYYVARDPEAAIRDLWALYDDAIKPEQRR